MKYITSLLLLAGTFVGAAETVSAQAVIQSWTGGSEYSAYYTGTTGDVIGFRFEVTSPVTVYDLGVWNGDTSGVGGLDSDHEVGIWDNTMTLLASTTVTPTSTVAGDFRYEAITPLTLSVGTVYTIGAAYTSADNDNYVSAATALTTLPMVNWINGVYPSAVSLGFVYPTLDAAPTSVGRFGPNFTIAPLGPPLPPPIHPSACGYGPPVPPTPILVEDFESGVFPPAGWTTADHTTNGTMVWETTSMTTQTNSVGTGEAACYDADDYLTVLGEAIHDSTLTSGPISVPTGSNLLEFEFYFNDYVDGQAVDLDVSTDGGVTWTNLETWDVDTLGITAAIDFTAYAGMTVNLRFRYYGTAYGTTTLYIWYTLVDDILFRPFTPPPPPVWSEDFDGGVFPPVGWTTFDNTTNGTMIWEPTSLTTQTNTIGSGEAACYDADDYLTVLGEVDHDSVLVSAPISIPSTGSVTGIYSLDFEFYFNDFVDGQAVDLDITADGGVTWTNLETWDVDTLGVSVSLDFAAYTGQTVQLRFRYYGTAYGTTSFSIWYTLVDDLAINEAPYLPVPQATATWRNDVGGTNVDMLDVSGPPLMGTYWSAYVDLSVSGLGYTQIFGYSGALSLNLGGTSRVILIDLTHPGGEILAAPIAAGPWAYYQFAIPNVCSLVGFPCSVQAAGFNIPNNAPWVLSNAQDLVLGF